MSDNAPEAKIIVNRAVETREVCGLNLRTRGDGGNTMRLSGGVDVKVSDEFAAAVIEEYYNGVLEDDV